jgi:hypothetical protein
MRAPGRRVPDGQFLAGNKRPEFICTARLIIPVKYFVESCLGAAFFMVQLFRLII